MTKVDVQKLAQLARIDVSAEELEELEKELPDILEFVEQIQKAGGKAEKETCSHYNVMREDGEPHDGSLYSDDLIAAMPQSKNGYLKVKKIINPD